MMLRSIAPKDLIRADFENLKSYEHLDTTPGIEELLFIQSLEGRAHNGSGVFHKRTYVNTTIDDVVKALEKEAEAIKKSRQALIDDIVSFARDVVHGAPRDRLVNDRGEPFLGIPFFKNRQVNPHQVLRGLYLGGLRDDAEVRKQAEARYNIKIGCGKCYLVHSGVMQEMHLDGEKLAHEPHEDQIEEFQKKGLILDSLDGVDPNQVRYFYIRHRLGPGQSDDAAMICSGILYHYDVALGVFLADAIDTLEKYAPVFRDQDNELAFFISRGFKDLNIRMEDVYELCYLAAIPELEEETVPDSSLRYLLSIDSRSMQSALRTHLDFIEGKQIVMMPVSFKRIPTPQFYDYIKRRLIQVRKLESLAVPALAIKELDRPALEVARRNFSVLSRDVDLSEVVKAFKESKSDIAILQDKNGKVIGIISPSDLLYLIEAVENRHA